MNAHRKLQFSLLICVALALGHVSSALADDTSAYNPKAPGGGPAIGGVLGAGGNVDVGGLGIQPDEFTGAATFSVPIPLPPGRGGLTPQMLMDYNSYRQNPNSYVGQGWDLSFGEIIRTPNKYGVVDYKNGTEVEVRLLGQTEHLYSISTGSTAEAYGISLPPGMTITEYQARVDVARNIYFHVTGGGKDGGWIVIDKNGTRYFFGEFSTSQDSADIAGMNQKAVARWLLSRVVDTNGNEIQIQYGFDFHPSSITYGDIEVVFNKASSDTVRYYPTFKEGFFHPVQGSRLESIVVNHKASGGAVRLLKYGFGYKDSISNGAPLLQKIYRFGTTDAATLPPISLDYFGNENPVFSNKESSVVASATSNGTYNPGYLGNKAALMDVNGDAIPDTILGYEKSGFLIKLSNGILGVDSGWKGFSDPLDGHCELNFCVGVINGLYKNSSGYYEWVATLDINGDSAPDRIVRKLSDGGKGMKFYVAYGIPGDMGWQNTLVAWNDPDNFYNPGVDDYTAGLIDMNGDGLPDRVVGDAKNGGFNVYYNQGNEFSSEAVFWKDPLAVASPNHPAIGKLEDYDDGKLYVATRDINGDGLPDRLYRTQIIAPDGPGKWKTEFGIHAAMNKNGLAWGQPVSADPGSCPSGVICTYFNSFDTLAISDPLANVADRGFITSETYDLIDFNHDGYLDRVEGVPSTGQIRINYYSGLSVNEKTVQFNAGATVILKDPVNDAGQGWAGSGYINKSDGGNLHTFIRDVNGDGFPDRVTMNPRGDTAEKQRTFYVYPFVTNALQFSGLKPFWDDPTVSQPPNALKSVDNGQGKRTAIEYIQSTAFVKVTRRLLPSVMHLVHKFYTQDSDAPVDSSPEGLRHPGMRWLTYEYKVANTYVQLGTDLTPYASRFNGFQRVDKIHAPMTGETWTPFTDQTFFHQAKGDIQAALPVENASEQTGYTVPALSGRIYKKMTYEASELRTKALFGWGFEKSTPNDLNPDCKLYDCKPQLGQRVDETYEAGSATPRKRSWAYKYDNDGNQTEEEFADNGVKKYTRVKSFWSVGNFAKGLQIRNRLFSDVVNSNGSILRKSETHYDPTGNPVMEQHYAGVGSSLTTNRTFGQYGNIKSWTAPDGVAHTHTYDSDNVFPITESITLPGGQVLTTQRGYHRTTGKLIKEINPHGVGSQMKLDDFGRPVSEDLISATGNLKPLHQWSYDYLQNIGLPGGSGTILRTQMWEAQPGFGMIKQQIAYTDGNGRTRQSCSLAENGMYRRIQNLTQNGGRTRMQTVPKFDADDCILLSQLAGATTTSTHDIFGRPTLVQPPAGDAGSPTAPTALMYVTDPTTGNLIRKTTLPNGTVHTEKINGFGQTISVDEGASGTSATYQYAPTGELLSTVIGGQNQMTAVYDWLGRKKTTTDADMGAWSYDYDTLGRLKTQTDAKKQKTVFDYDTVGRVTQKQFLGSTGVVEKTEKYFYDVSAGQGFDVLPGELAQVIETASGGAALRSSAFSYDPSYRRMAKMQRSITGVGDFTQSFVNNFKGQMTSTTYPGGKSVYQTYNQIGGLNQVCASADCLDYYYLPVNFDAYGAVVNEMFGNGVQVKNDYYPNTHRLQTRTTYRDGKNYAKREYQYNALSSLTSLSDPLNQLGSGAMTGITFDGQDRLKGYQPAAGELVGIAYATNGNILANSDSYGGKTYKYDGPRPHAVTAIGTDTFDYDANGNMVKDASRTMAYSATNQLTQVKMANGGVVDMDYDFTGARVLKKSVIKDVNGKTWQTTTHYLGEAMEVRLAPIELGADGKPISPLPPGEGQGEGAVQKGTVLLHVSANGQRVATMTVGTLADVLKPAAGTIWGIPFNQLPPLVAFSLLLAMLIAVMPGLTRHPVCRSPFTLRLSKAALVALFLVVVQVASVPLALAGDAGLPAIPPSDTNYLVFYHGDHLGSAQLITEGNTKGKHAGITYKRGDVIQRFEYAAYGRESFVLNPNLAWDPAFTGQQYDIETGLYYYRARYYNPILGRFIQPDTIVQDPLDPQSWNRYAYVRNNPLKYVDPSGHSAISDKVNAETADMSDSELHDYFFDTLSLQDNIDYYNDGLNNDNSSSEPATAVSEHYKDPTTNTGNGPAHANAGDGHGDGGSGSGREEGGLVGASVSGGGGAAVSGGAGGMSLPGALNVARNVNDVVGWAGVAISMVAPQIGGPILIGSMIAGIAIDLVDLSAGGISGTQFVVNTGASIIGHRAGGAIAKAAGFGYGYSKAAGRYFSKGGSLISKSRGGFIRTEVGIMGQFVEHFIGVDVDLGLRASWELLGGEK